MQRGGAEGGVSNQGCEIPTIKLFTYSEQSCQDVPKAFYGIKYLSSKKERRPLQIDPTDFQSRVVNGEENDLKSLPGTNFPGLCFLLTLDLDMLLFSILFLVL